MPRRFPSALAAAVALTLVSGAAFADPVNFTGTYAVSGNTGSNGLAISTQDENSSLGSKGNLSFSLNAGQSTGQKALFDIYTLESSVTPDDATAHTITADFTFTAPTPSFGGDATGTTVEQNLGFLGFYKEGVLTWDNNGVFDIAYPGGGNGDLQVTLTGGDFNVGLFGLDAGSHDGLTVMANFTNVNDPANVPEPASVALLGIGLLGLGMVGMRRRGRNGTAA